MQDDREAARKELESKDQNDQDAQQSDSTSSNDHSNSSDSSSQSSDNSASSGDKSKSSSQEKTPPPMNLGEATGRALFQGPEASKINKPGAGVPKRSLRLTRLILVLLISVGCLIVMVGFTRHPGLGILRVLGVLAFLAASVWGFFVSYGLWRKLQ